MNLPAGYETDLVIRLEANLDDTTGELLGRAMERLLAAGALDVWFTPIQMKKLRPAVMLSALATPGMEGALAEVFFTETSTFGLRMEEVRRVKLERKFMEVETTYGRVQVKLGLRGGAVCQVAPEFESCRALSEATGVALRVIYEAAKAHAIA